MYKYFFGSPGDVPMLRSSEGMGLALESAGTTYVSIRRRSNTGGLLL
jgi:hypothetical protein